MLKSVNFPTEWTTVPFGRIAPRVQDSGRPDLESLSVFLGAGVVPRSSREDNHNQLGEDMSKYLVVEPGDIVFNKLRTWQGGLGASKYLGLVSPAYFVCRPKPNFDPTFLQYLLLSSTYLQELTRISKWQPPSQFDIGWEQLKLLPIVAPEIAEQKAIADYLDRETIRIDALVNKKQQELGLLSEFRTAYISRELSQIRNQSTVKLKYLFRIVGGGTPSADPSNWGGQVQWATPVDLAKSNGDVIANTERTLSSEGLQSQSRLVGASSIIISTRAPIGYVSQCVVPMSFNQGCKGLEPKIDLDARFFLHQMSTLAETLNSLGQGSTFKELSSESLSQVHLKMTDIATQRTVSKKIDEKMLLIARAIVSTTKQIELLRERRQALISAAVTGELGVPEVPA